MNRKQVHNLLFDLRKDWLRWHELLDIYDEPRQQEIISFFILDNEALQEVLEDTWTHGNTGKRVAREVS